MIEGMLTFFLVFVVFAVAVDDRGAFSKVAGLPIGLVDHVRHPAWEAP